MKTIVKIYKLMYFNEREGFLYDPEIVGYENRNNYYQPVIVKAEYTKEEPEQPKEE